VEGENQNIRFGSTRKKSKREPVPDFQRLKRKNHCKEGEPFARLLEKTHSTQKKVRGVISFARKKETCPPPFHGKGRGRRVNYE